MGEEGLVEAAVARMYVDTSVLSIRCPKCSTTLTSRQMHRSGLACGGNCGVKLSELAAECSRVYRPLSYLYVDKISGVVKYIGTTNDLKRRLLEHPHGVLSRVEAPSGASGLGGVAGSKRAKASFVTKGEVAMEEAGVRLHVSLHANEWLLGELAPLGPPSKGVLGGVPPKLNRQAPPTAGVRYRCVRLTSSGVAEVATYKPADCRHRDAEALSLRCWVRRFAALHKDDGSIWTERRRTTSAADRDRQLGEVEMPGVGRLSASRTTMVAGKTQHEWASLRLNGTTKSCLWPVLRQGECEHQASYGYCRCRVPCRRLPLVPEATFGAASGGSCRGSRSRGGKHGRRGCSARTPGGSTTCWTRTRRTCSTR